MTISDDAVRAYLLVWLALVMTAMAALFSLIAIGMAFGAPDVKTESLVRHRAAQMAGLKADLIVVGDSSAGYGIGDSVGAPLGLRSVNLALNGSFGLAGTRAMMERARAASGARVFLIVQTADMLGRPAPALAVARARPFGQRSLRDHVRLALRYYNTSDLLAIARTLVRVVLGEDVPAAPRDIYRTQSAGRPLGGQRVVTLAMVRDDPHAMAALADIADYCRRERLDCLYAHGPLWDEACAKLRAGIARRSARIAALQNPHFRLLGASPVCMPRTIVGDTPDHVRPSHADVTTRAYAGLLLAASPSSALSSRLR